MSPISKPPFPLPIVQSPTTNIRCGRSSCKRRWPREPNRQFALWVEHDYNAAAHDAIGMKPIDRFGIDLARVRFLAPSEHNDELFFAEAVRKVKKDNTFSFLSRRYETPVDLRDKEIQLRYERHRSDNAAVVIYYKGQRMGAARLLDAVANGLARRKEQQP